MKYSIIIVAYNAFDLLKKCRDSIWASNITDYEIVIVDNSPEEMPDFPVKLVHLIQVYRGGKNHGFAEGCNIGARLAKGEILIFLNPDTEVYGDWADQMAKYMADDVGAVGPISNFVAGIQRVDYHMQPCERPQETAERAAEVLKGRAVESKLIIGFCCMMRKSVYEKMGGMDPDLFLGNDDLDLSWRLRLAGYTLLVASDVFVYHEGHKSFETRPRPEVQKLLQESEDALRAKLNAFYQGNPPSSVELWGADFFNTQIRQPMTLSVCMIATDGESNNLLSLVPQLGFADEVVICNTGSDGFESWLRTYQFASGQKWGDPARFEPCRARWAEDFSAARNVALSHCHGDYVLWLDCDDRVPEESGKLIAAALRNPGPKTWNKKAFFEFTIEDMEKTGVARRFFQPRLFPNLHQDTWEGRIHESIMPTMGRHGIEPVRVNITLQHTGYMTPEDRERKAERNIRILNADEDSPFKFYNISQSLAMVGKWEEAKQNYDRTLTMEWPEPLWPPFRDQTRIQAIKCLLNLDRPLDLGPYLEGNIAPDAVYYGGRYMEEKGERWRAIEFYRQYLEITEKMPNWPYEVDSPKNRTFAYAGMINLIADEHAEWLKKSEAELQGA